jgi:hypothetical protein
MLGLAGGPDHPSLAELERPLPHRFVADEDAAGRQHLLDHPQAEREAEVEPDRVADTSGGNRWPAYEGVVCGIVPSR